MTTYEVANIDKVAPTAPTASADVTAPTNGGVTVTAVFSDDSVVKEYSTDGTGWRAYTEPVVLSENGTVSFRGMDEAGNVSEVTSLVVDNIVEDVVTEGHGSGTQTVELAAPGAYVLTGDFGDITGTVTLFNGGRKVASGTLRNGVLSFNNGASVLLDSALPTEVQVDVQRGKDADYQVSLVAEKVYGQTDADSLENPTLLDIVSEPGATLVADGHVGFGDAADFLELTLDDPANLSLDFTATDAVRFTLTVFSVKDGELTKLKSVTATAKKPSATIAALALAGGDYVVEVRAKDADAGLGSHYTLAVDEVRPFTGLDNNTWAKATAAGDGFQGCLAKDGDGVDSVDYLDLSSWEGGLSLEMEAGKAKVSFYDGRKRALRLSSVTCADGSVKSDVVSLTLKDGDGLMDAIQVAALDETVKYLKVEGAGSGLNAYRLGMLA